MEKKTIKEIIQGVKPGKPKSVSLDGVEIEGYRQEAARLNKEARDKGIIIPKGKPHYTISANKRAGCLFIINNSQ